MLSVVVSSTGQWSLLVSAHWHSTFKPSFGLSPADIKLDVEHKYPCICTSGSNPLK